MLAQCLDQWREQLAGRSYPTCHRGAVKIDALASVDLCLAIQRAVIGIFCDEHMGQQSGPARPRSMVRGGAGAWTTRSHPVQANFGRTWRITLKLAGMYSSISATSSPKLRSASPQSGQQSCSG